MKTEVEIFISSLVIFVWTLSAWEALSQLSGGKVRRILAKNRHLAERAEEWIENRHAYNIVFRILAFSFLAVTISFAFALFLNPGKSTMPGFETAGWAVLSTFVVVVIADLFAKVAVLYFDTIILKLSMPIIKGLRYSLFLPVVWLIVLIEDRLEDWQQQHTPEQEEDKATTEDEIMSLVEQDDESDGHSQLEEDEKRMIRGIFDLDDTPVREIMTPRVDVTGVEIEESVDDAINTFIDTGHSRIPVYEDTIDEIKGIIFAKDFLVKDIKSKTLEELCHKPLFIPETKPVGDLLDEIKISRNHFAVVIDEYGGTSGIITFEDIIEEIVGEIRDEYDTEEEDEAELVRMPDGSMIFDARTLICDVNEELEQAQLPEDEDVDTIGGLVCGEFGKIPEAGETIVIDESVDITVLKADSRKILTLKLKELEAGNDK